MAMVSTGKVSMVLVRSLLNHFIKRFWSHDRPSQSGLEPSGNTKLPNSDSK